MTRSENLIIKELEEKIKRVNNILCGFTIKPEPNDELVEAQSLIARSQSIVEALSADAGVLRL